MTEPSVMLIAPYDVRIDGQRYTKGTALPFDGDTASAMMTHGWTQAETETIEDDERTEVDDHG